jgi:hypothetical protein
MSTLLADYSPLAYDSGRRHAALTNITYNFDERMTPNTFYYEGTSGRYNLCLRMLLSSSGGRSLAMFLTGLQLRSPFLSDDRCGESSPGTTTAIQDMMLISALGRVSVFPGISDADITSASFHQACGNAEKWTTLPGWLTCSLTL